MSNGDLDSTAPRFGRFRNWLSLAGFITMLASLFAFLLLFTFDLVRPASNPYVGVLTYLVAPIFTTIGLCLVALGVLLRRRGVPAGGPTGRLVIDLSRTKDRRILGYFAGGGVLFLLITAVGSYHSYKFTESVTFCGQACHTVMEPEMVTYQHSPHARVACVECHIGPGAKWFVKAKLSGLYQVYATAADKYPRPIPTPIENLSPARDTCEHCHWPQKFSGNLVQKLRAEMVTIIENLAKERGLELVLDVVQSGVVTFSPTVDITDEVIRRYDQSKAATPPVKK
jgi:nitrate/TMAO reductase-like tetraheme cytochrome c subunit